MTTDKLVSVIIPAYNHELYIREAIQSVIEQSYPLIELIVIDDGSRDRTWEIINKMREQCETRFVNTIFERQVNQGTCLTLNRLIALSSGEYIQFLASDDKLSTGSTQTLYDFLSISPDYALVVGKNKLIDDKSKICYWDNNLNITYKKNEAIYLSFNDLLNLRVNLKSDQFGSYEHLLRGNHVSNGYLIRRNIFDKIGPFTPMAPLEDYWLMLQISKYSKLKYIDETTFYYRWHNSNTVSQIEKMANITHKTLQYEMHIISAPEHKLALNIFNTVFIDKIYFHIPLFIKLYRVKNPKQESLILAILSYKIYLKRVLY